MTRRSRREIERAVADLRDNRTPDRVGVWTIIPEGAVPPEERDDLPDVETDGIRVHDPDSGEQVVTAPYHHPPSYSGIEVVTPREVAAIWKSLPTEVREREQAYREKIGEPIPPILRSESA